VIATPQWSVRREENYRVQGEVREKVVARRNGVNMEHSFFFNNV
jgi:hypothetical protein